MRSEATPPGANKHVQRFHINLAILCCGVLFLLLLARRSNSYVELDEGAVTIRMGPLFRLSTPRDGVEGVRSRGWAWPLGWGWRYNLRGTIGLIGARSVVVEIALREPRWVRLVFSPFAAAEWP
jgi:hypothetical protein